MQWNKNKTIAIVIALILVITIAIPFFDLPEANAHTPPWTLETWAYIAVAPNPVGVGQPVYVNMWVDKPMPEAALNDIRRHNYQLTITKPDGINETHTFDLSDPTGVQFYKFVPDQVGVYSFVFFYPGQTYIWNATAAQRVFTNDIFQPATSKTVTLTVQNEPLPAAISSYPLPQEYWTRPIEGQNTDWWSVSSNYLEAPQIIDGVYQPDGIAPNSAHIMWTKPLQFGGVVGGTNTGINGMTYYTGLSYEIRFTTTIIINGRLYYALPRSNSASGDGFACVDLRTGEDIFWQNSTMPSFGQLEWYDSSNQHGVIPNGYLWKTSGTTYMAYDAIDGNWLFNITDVPSGTRAIGPNGEILIYTLSVNGGWLSMWNYTKCFPEETTVMSAYRPVGQVINGTNGYSWNKTLSAPIAGASTIRYAINDDILLFSNIATTYTTYYGTRDPYTVGAISLKPASRGTVLWMTNYTAPQPQANTIGVTRVYLTTDPVNRVFMMREKETMINLGYSLDDGKLLWTTTPLTQVPDWEYFSTSGFTAYGKLYYSGFGGILYAFDTKDGTLLWTYGNGESGNSTNNGLNTPWGLSPINVGAIADGKVYCFTTEHSPNEPMYKNSYVRAINASTGTEIWKILSWPNPGSFSAPGFAVADGYLTYFNCYDGQIYTLGKGPSELTVSITNDVTQSGSSVMIKGSITDVSAGTKQKDQTARFPLGVPAVSDASQSAWMEYVYMQKPRPTTTTGVPITLSVVDSNGNYREIGSVTSDADGFYNLNWKPDIEGKYTVYASFGGSESYWPSHAVTAFAVDPAASTPAPTQALTQSTTDMYFVPAIAGIIVTIVICFAITILVLRKRP
ncbi:MAG TPA: PQQ-binding-like beta-propeller repeat protein [Candidatus Bathyarchaeia archaeon]